MLLGKNPGLKEFYELDDVINSLYKIYGLGSRLYAIYGLDDIILNIKGRKFKQYLLKIIHIYNYMVTCKNILT